MTDYVLPHERVNPPSFIRRWLLNFISEVIWRYQLKIARFEYEKAKEAKAWVLARDWGGHVETLEDLLKRLGVDPRKEPEDLQKSFEVWLFGLTVASCVLFAWMFTLYRGALIELIWRAS